MFDKYYKEGYSREEKIEAFRRSVADQKRYRHNDGQRYVYITDGVKIKKVDPDLPIPEGWRRGYPKKRGVENEQ